MESNAIRSDMEIATEKSAPTAGLDKAPPIEKETRFAVVMYGGVSLAIYIHGVVQELYKMVQATARHPRHDGYYLLGWGDLDNAGQIYRSLGEVLKTRFVVDILSGTSAGGINAVYLAKALVNDQSLQMLKQMWVDEGDIGKLLNDRESVKKPKLKSHFPPSSLMNNQRMYYHLLNALKIMGEESSEPIVRSPYVNELDLYITATDIRGLNLPIQIANTTVNELRYKSVFHFRYAVPEASGDPGGITPDRLGKGLNQFDRIFDPVLAFAARCTSSIPPAFEPVQFQDVKEILSHPDFRNLPQYAYKTKQWESIFSDYMSKSTDQDETKNPLKDFEVRSFGDGGYLDNKPFSYATETLLHRRADLPVDRKLIYIEPSPEHPERDEGSIERPNAIHNLAAALLTLPRQETIREDLKVIVERNAIIEKINRVLDVNAFKTKAHFSSNEPGWVHTTVWGNKYLLEKDVIGWYGTAYLAYHQLRVDDVIHNLATAFIRAIGLQEDGRDEEEMLKLVNRWRDELYTTEKPKTKKTGRDYSENDILFRLDYSFRTRKFHFLQKIINIFLVNMDDLLSGDAQSSVSKILDASKSVFHITRQNKDEFIEELKGIKKDLNRIYAYLRARGRILRARGLVDAFQLTNDQEDFVSLKNYADNLRRLKEIRAFGGNVDNAAAAGILEDITASLARTFNRSGEKVAPEASKGYLGDTFAVVSAEVRDESMLDLQRWRGNGKGKRKETRLSVKQQIQKCLSYYYDNFEYYDMLIYPIQYGTDVGESDVVEVVRISPDDATQMWGKDRSEEKLAGTKFMNFSAFFAKEWRENDMLWGRLDAAEILIEEFLQNAGSQPGKLEDLKERFKQNLANHGDKDGLSKKNIEPVKLVQTAILREDFFPALRENVYGLFANQRNLRKMTQQMFGGPSFTYEMMKDFERSDEKLFEYFQKGYRVNLDYPSGTVRLISRAVKVLDGMLQELSKGSPALQRILTFVSRVFTSLLLAATGGSITTAVAAVFYLCGVLLMIAGNLLPGFADGVLVGGLTVLLTASVHLFTLKFKSMFGSDLLQSRAGDIVAGILSTLFALAAASILAALVLLIYIGTVHLGAPVPDNVLGNWIKALIEAIKIR